MLWSHHGLLFSSDAMISSCWTLVLIINQENVYFFILYIFYFQLGSKEGETYRQGPAAVPNDMPYNSLKNCIIKSITANGDELKEILQHLRGTGRYRIQFNTPTCIYYSISVWQWHYMQCIFNICYWKHENIIHNKQKSIKKHLSSQVYAVQCSFTAYYLWLFLRCFDVNIFIPLAWKQ